MMGGSGPTAWAALTCLGEQYNSTINYTLQDTNHKGPWNVGTRMGGSGPTAWAALTCLGEQYNSTINYTLNVTERVFYNL